MNTLNAATTLVKNNVPKYFFHFLAGYLILQVGLAIIPIGTRILSNTFTEYFVWNLSTFTWILVPATIVFFIYNIRNQNKFPLLRVVFHIALFILFFLVVPLVVHAVSLYLLPTYRSTNFFMYTSYYTSTIWESLRVTSLILGTTVIYHWIEKTSFYKGDTQTSLMFFKPFIIASTFWMVCGAIIITFHKSLPFLKKLDIVYYGRGCADRMAFSGGGACFGPWDPYVLFFGVNGFYYPMIFFLSILMGGVSYTILFLLRKKLRFLNPQVLIILTLISMYLSIWMVSPLFRLTY